MNVIFLKKFPVNIELVADRTNIADGCHGRFLHDIPQMSGQFKLAFARHYIDLDRKGITAYTGPCQPPDDANLILRIGHLIIIFLRAKEMFQVLLCHFDILLAILQDHACCLSADIAQTAFQTTDAGLTGIVENDIFNGLIADRQLFRLDAVGFHLLLNQMLFGNMKLLILCIRIDLDDLHTV